MTKTVSYLAVILLAISAVLTAQTITTGDIAGTVTDPTGAVVANATATLTNDATGEVKTITTGNTGEFHFNLLRPGTYTLAVNAAGFQQLTSRVNVNLGQVSRAPVQLGLQTQSEVVNVTEQAALVQSENANLATTFNTSEIVNLPAPGNDMTTYAFTTPGVIVSTGAGYGSFSAFGMPGVSNLFTVNGNDNMDPYLNLNNSGASNLTLGNNEIMEAAVVVNGYTGQYGRQAGAQVNYVTKSGSNQFHANAAWQWNGSRLNANDWFNNANATDRPHAVSNEWAGSVGGPIVKNKAFFFFDNEGLRYVLPSGGPVYVPTTSFMNSVLTNIKANNPAALPLYQQASTVWAGSSGASRAVPVTAADDDALGCGDFAGTGAWGVTQPCAAKFQSAVNALNTEWLMAIKGDVNLTNNDRIYLRYNTDHGIQATSTDPINPAFSANSVQPSYGGQFGYTRTITPTMVNDLRLSASYYTAIFGPPDIASALKTFPTTWAFNDGMYGTPVGNAMGGADNTYPQGRKVRQWQLIDDYSIAKGNHNIKFGTNIRKNFISTYAMFPGTSGLFTFNSMTDFVNGMLTSDGGSTYSQTFTNYGAQRLTMYSAGFYGQDEWRIRHNLTVTLALRLDRNSNITCGASCFNELVGQPFGSVNHSATTPYNQVIKTGLGQAFPSVEPVVLGPRVGMAWSITPKTVIRGGFGLFSDLYQGLIADRLITNSPAVASFTATSGNVATSGAGSAGAIVAASNAAFQSGFANGATLAQLQALVPGFAKPNYNTVSGELYNPKFAEWNFQVEQALGNNYMFSVNYVGNHGWDLINQLYGPNAYAKTGNVVAGFPSAAPDSRFGQIRELNNAGWSNYGGLVTNFKWRMGSQFLGSFSYTWSHALDTCSNECLQPFNALAAPSLRYQVNPVDLRALNYSSADYDSRHSFNANYVYKIAPALFNNGLLKRAVGGWTVAGTFLFHSGYPFSVLNTGVRSKLSNVSGIANYTPLADYLGTGSVTCSTPNVACMTASQFATSANQKDYGNIPRNFFRGPNYFDTDLSVNKVINVGERVKFTIGAYFFNVLNHPNFDNPFNNVALGTFGQILETVSPYSSPYGSFTGSAVSGRVIQSLAKFEF